MNGVLGGVVYWKVVKPLWFSTLLLCEYSTIVSMCLIFCVLLGLNISLCAALLFGVALLRSTINRLRFDELMSAAWQYCLPVVWTALLFCVLV